MDTPPIRYTSTEDHFSIAYLDAGDGYPILHLPYPMNHLQLQWEHQVFRESLESLASRYRLVAFDGRGQGLSDQHGSDHSLDKLLLDAEAVVEATGIKRFALFCGFSTPLALAFAAKHPEMVSHLLLWCPMQRRNTDRENPHTLEEAHRLLSAIDWELYLETLTFWLGFDPESETGRRVFEFLREGVHEDAYRQIFAGIGNFDGAELVPLIKAPALLMQPRQGRTTDMASARMLASVLPESQIAVFEGRISIPSGNELTRIMETIDQFIGTPEEPQPEEEAPARAAPVTGGLQSILFTDVEGSTDLTDRFGDARSRELMRTHEEITRRALSEFGGAEIKTMGDGFMTSFTSATGALDCAITLQRSFDLHNESAEVPLRIRIGINAGEPIAEDDDLFGTAVIVAARVAAQASGNEILTTDVVRQLVAGKDFLFHDRGVAPLKGFDEPIRLFEVRWRQS